MKKFKVNIIYRDGNPARKEVVRANNAPQAKEFAEARFGGEATSANECWF